MVPDWVEEAFASVRQEDGTPAELALLDRLEAQIDFVLELDRAKTVLRRSYLTDGSRLENDAEHMWHVMLAGLLLAEHADEPVDPLRLALMLAVHDIVEIDAGDTFIYDAAGRLDKAERESEAADRLFGLLPPDQGEMLRGLWEEFEARATPTARMAASMDRLLPLMMNRATAGRSWREHGVSADRVFAVNSTIAKGSLRIWALASAMLDGAVAEGCLGPAAAGEPGQASGSASGVGRDALH